jgi:hypothetical protein
MQPRRLSLQGKPGHHAYIIIIVQEAEAAGKPVVGTAAAPYAPMTVVGDVLDSGLGLVSWWDEDQDVEDGE